MNLLTYTNDFPIVPYIREADDYAFRTAYYFPFRKLLDYLIIYVKRGTLKVVADEAELLFHEGEFCLLQPGTIHDLQAFEENETPFAHLDFFFNRHRESSFPTKPGQVDLSGHTELMQPKLNEFDQMSIPIKLVPTNPHIYRNLMFGMIKSWLEPSPLAKLKAQAFATQLLQHIIEDHSKFVSSAAQYDLDWIPSYFSFHLAEPLNLDDLSKRAHLSPSRFRAVFRERFGMPPHQYLMQTRLEHAKDLLASSTYSISQIAEYCGFSDVSHFTHVFKAKVGTPPGLFRENK
ncbi:AraC family transcriptional regulator [Paenibacillus glycanilyticus]|uniref:AraC family transcriptional regulator n=1 Tax=Paenibacillus glycanilyticus TaxID=126569 RepID=A0ABQ6GKQ2_9BACL|nr:AraC family transcriptional regulator [Paenibacillus glycanilyticus]GLX70820.1 AraC family transcriptional regulator [Paenibacillus glycanilyticus]